MAKRKKIQSDIKIAQSIKLKPIEDSEKKELETLFKKYGIEQSADSFRSIVPKVYGRHDYVMFKPTHKKRAEV